LAARGAPGRRGLGREARELGLPTGLEVTPPTPPMDDARSLLPDGGGRKRKEDERFASVERDEAVLHLRGTRRQNASPVCMFCGRAFFNAKTLCAVHFCFCMSLLDSALALMRFRQPWTGGPRVLSLPLRIKVNVVCTVSHNHRHVYV
jgi:hypothetical protein